MRPRIATFGVLLLACTIVSTPRPVLHAQQAATAATSCSLTWIGHESEIEQYMLSATVAKMEQVPIGVTKPQRVVFEPGGPVGRAAWKPLLPSYRSGFHESYKAELAAYALDRLLEMHMVPPVIERKIDRATGALVYWIENIHPWDIKKPPTGPEPNWSRQTTRMRMFDQLIANIDRNAGNLLYDDDWHLFLIDHSRAFIERKDLKGTTAPARIDRVLWQRMDALTKEQLDASLGQWLSRGEIEAILARRDKMRDAVAEMVKKRGEVGVFF
jgi:hypothetical protein